MAWLTLLAPIVLELLKIFFGKRDDAETLKKAQQDIMEKLRLIREAMSKAQESEGDTSDLEDIVNKK